MVTYDSEVTKEDQVSTSLDSLIHNVEDTRRDWVSTNLDVITYHQEVTRGIQVSTNLDLIVTVTIVTILTGIYGKASWQGRQ